MYWNIQNTALCLLLCVGVSSEEVLSSNKDFRKLDTVSVIRESEFINGINYHQKRRDQREVLFSTSKDTESFENESRDTRHGRVPTRVKIGRPVVKVTRSEVQGLIGSDNVTLECFIDSFPKATNFWMKGDVEHLKPQDHIGKYNITEDTLRHYQFRDRLRLHFLNLEEDDIASNFRCVSSNEYGTDTGLVHLTAPAYLQSTPHPANGLLEVRLGSRVVLQCDVKGFPLVITYWFRNNTGEQLTWSDQYHVTEQKVSSAHYISRLHIRRVENSDFTVFKCVSKNTIGESQHTFRILKSGSSPSQRSRSIAPRKSIFFLESFLVIMMGTVSIFF